MGPNAFVAIVHNYIKNNKCQRLKCLIDTNILLGNHMQWYVYEKTQTWQYFILRWYKFTYLRHRERERERERES